MRFVKSRLRSYVGYLPNKVELVLRRKPLDDKRGLLNIDGRVFEAAIGRSGRTIFKREGDGATPISAMKLLYGFQKQGVGALNIAASKSALSMRRVLDLYGWCDAVGHGSYNRLVRQPFSHRHEKLIRSDILYDLIIVMDWNISCRKQGCGSAIFFHVAKPDYSPTEGCVAISKAAMIRLLPLLNRHVVMKVI